ncbi:MAG: STAS domain-containing protein [Acidobacteriota bacterium]|jgi:anti-anti-sigma factor|nr:STAS domain-containing protein [Acidobacteriota bacterium]
MRNDDFEIKKEVVDESVKFILKGRLDAINSSARLYQLEDALGTGNKNMILNMTLVEYISSAGIRAILKTYKQAEDAGGKLRIERPSENVKNVLGMTALDQMLVQ